MPNPSIAWTAWFAVLCVAVLGCQREEAPRLDVAPPAVIDAEPEPRADCRGHWHVDRASFERNAPEAIAMLEQAPDALERFTGRANVLRFDDEPGETCTIRALRDGEEEASLVDASHSGEYSWETGNIRIVIDRMPACDGAEVDVPCVASVLLHELLHGYGLVHVKDDEEGIMHPSVIEPFFTEADRRVCRAAGLCE